MPINKKIQTCNSKRCGRGFGRGLLERENPLKTMLSDSALSALGGGAVGYMGGQLLKNLARNNAIKTGNANNYISDYINGRAWGYFLSLCPSPTGEGMILRGNWLKTPYLCLYSISFRFYNVYYSYRRSILYSRYRPLKYKLIFINLYTYTSRQCFF